MKNISIPQVYIQKWVIVFAFTFSLCITKSSNTFADQVPGRIQLTGTLPVVLTPLKGYYSNGVSHLYWKSLQESNSSHYEIERSNDGINYSQVGKVIAKGSSDKEVDYSFDDIKSNAGLNYYRLKLQDRDGKFQYSNIEVLNVNIKGIYVTGIYPGPFVDKLNVTISSEVNAQTSIELFDNTGKLIISQKSVLNTGITNLVVDNLSSLSKGLYIIKVQAGETVIIKKLIK